MELSIGQAGVGASVRERGPSVGLRYFLETKSRGYPDCAIALVTTVFVGSQGGSRDCQTGIDLVELLTRQANRLQVALAMSPGPYRDAVFDSISSSLDAVRRWLDRGVAQG